MKLTTPKKIADIVRPPYIGMSETPALDMSVSLVDAVERMLENDLTTIAVAGNGRIVGYIRLSDALRSLGLPRPEPIS